MMNDLVGMRDHYDEEVSSKENVIRQQSKSNAEAEMMKLRYEKEGVAKAEELEMAKLKMQARLSEAEATADQLNAKLSQVEKSKAKLQADLDSMAAQLDQAQILNSSMDADVTPRAKGPDENFQLFAPKSKEDYVCLRIDDLKTLQNGHWLNDQVIKYEMTNLYHHVLPSEDRKEVLMLNSFFYDVLTNRKDGSPDTAPSRHLKVANWTKDVDIFEKDLLVIPICEPEDSRPARRSSLQK